MILIFDQFDARRKQADYTECTRLAMLNDSLITKDFFSPGLEREREEEFRWKRIVRIKCRTQYSQHETTIKIVLLKSLSNIKHSNRARQCSINGKQ